jgi:hypothetical protein
MMSMGRTRLRLSRRRKLLALLYGPPKASLDMFFNFSSRNLLISSSLSRLGYAW